VPAIVDGPANQALVQDHPECPDLCFLVVDVALERLGGHVGRGPHTVLE
jgi:hypothetical protein